jgi:hypothetical protein
MQYNASAKQHYDALHKIEQAKVQASSEFQAQQRAQQGAQREAWNRKADEVAKSEIEKAVPNVPYKEIQKAARDLFSEMGVDEAVIRRHWEGEPMQMRSPAIQTIIAQAALYRKMQAKAATIRATPKPIPPSQRPGVIGQVHVAQDAGNISDLKAQLAKAKGTKALDIATRLHQAQRAARGNWA